MDSIPYKKIVEIINEGLYIVNKDRVITYWNNAAERMKLLGGHVLMTS
jgi:PAS domain-containing protein